MFPDTERQAQHTPITFEGLLIQPIKSAIDKMLAEPMNERNIRTAVDATRMLIAQGQNGDAVLRGLVSYGQGQVRTAQQRAALQNMVNKLMQSGAPQVDQAKTRN